MSKYLFLIFSVASFVSAQLLLKKGIKLIGHLDFNLANFLNLLSKIFTNIYIFLGLALLGFGFFIWLFVLSRFKLSIAYPVNTSAAIALIAFLSWLIFKESLGAIQIIGIALIIAGIFLIAR